jgi:hypothetical protein
MVLPGQLESVEVLQFADIKLFQSLIRHVYSKEVSLYNIASDAGAEQWVVCF